MNRPTRFRNAVVASAAGLVAAIAPPALAGDEYVAVSATGLYEAPPAGATPQIGPSQDDATREVALPFEFPYFGRIHSKVSVCSNGWLAFGATTNTDSANAALPSVVAPNGIVAALWDDLATGTGSVKSFTSGTAPNRVFVLSWDAVDTFSGLTDDVLSFQVRLHETSGVIEIAYAPDGTWDGLSYTAGIEDPSGTLAFGAGSTANDRSGRPALDWRFTPRAAAIAGKILRDRPAATSTGLGTTTETGLPVVGIDLELVREDTGEVAARGRTTADGTFTLTSRGVDAPTTFALDVIASGAESRVVDGTGTVYRHRLATGIASNPVPASVTYTLGASVDATNASIRRAVNIQQAAVRGFAWANAAAAYSVFESDPAVEAATFPSLDFRWVAGAAAQGGRTVYQPATTTAAALVLVHEGTDNPDPWDDDVILRECGHHVFSRITTYPGAQSARSWAAATTAPGAFLDGFAHWFACVVQGRTQFVDTRSASAASVFDLEAATPAPRFAPDVTGAVACSLWDLVDVANETWDEFAGTYTGTGSTAQQVYRTIDIDLGTPAAGTTLDVGSFFAAWRKSGPDADRQQTARVFIHHGSLPDDAREPNDRAGESSVAATARIDGLTLSPWNEDRFSFAFAPSAPAPVVATVTQTGATEFDVQVLDAGGAQVAAGTNVGATPKNRVTATSPSPAAAGTYTVRIVWRSGPATSYSIAFFEPLRLTGTPLPEWTAGLPYKADLGGAGGIPPYTFTTSASVPGLAVSNAGARISGTPTDEGTYDVTVALTDASGAGTVLTSALNLVVHGPLVLHEFFGLAADRDVAADVGSGGTSPEWVAGTSPGGGLTLAGGATLRLTGSAGVPRTFLVEGSASDAVGAVVPLSQSQVVVCALVPSRGSVPVADGTHFGLWFDALAGSVADLGFRFRGTGERPELVALVDGTGRQHDLEDRVTASGRTVRLSGVEIPRTGRWFAIFEQQANPFRGEVSVGGGITGPREVHGVAVLGTADAVVDVPFDAIAGSRLRILAREELLPSPPTPSIFGLRDPTGADVGLPAVRRTRGAQTSVSVNVTLRDLSGTYVLRLAGDGKRTGPVFYRVRIDPPTRAFALF
jgi:hypothetical protein